MEEKNKDIVIDGQQETLLFQDACMIIDEAQAVAFYNYHPDFFYAVSRKSVGTDQNIFHALRGKCSIRLTWSHYAIILQDSFAT